MTQETRRASLPPEPPLGGARARVISIQSQVVHGHVGNNAALFPMQALGVDAAAVPTTLLSNHPLYPTTRGRALEAGLVSDLLLGVEERGLVEAAQALLTGYLGAPATGLAVADFAARAKAANPRLLYVCDPVIGDDGRVFVAESLIAVFRERLVPLATILTPNQFELECLTGAPARDVAGLREAVAGLMRRGPRAVVVTGCALEDTPAGEIETIVCEGGTLRRIVAPRLPIRPHGAGDLFAGALTARLARGEELYAAALASVAAVSAVLERTLAEGAYELCLSVADFMAAAAKP